MLTLILDKEEREVKKEVKEISGKKQGPACGDIPKGAIVAFTSLWSPTALQCWYCKPIQPLRDTKVDLRGQPTTDTINQYNS